MFYDVECELCKRITRLQLISPPEQSYFVVVDPDKALYRRIEVKDWPEMDHSHLGCIYCDNQLAIKLKPIEPLSLKVEPKVVSN